MTDDSLYSISKYKDANKETDNEAGHAEHPRHGVTNVSGVPCGLSQRTSRRHPGRPGPQVQRSTGPPTRALLGKCRSRLVRARNQITLRYAYEKEDE
jgi:hypothetical protein